MIINELLKACSVMHSSKIAIKDNDSNKCYTYEEIEKIVKLASCWFREKGIKKSDRICILSRVCLEAIFAFWGAARLGAITIFLDHSIGVEPLKYIISQTEPRLTFSSSDGLKTFNDARLPAFEIEQLSFLKAPESLRYYELLKKSRLNIEENKLSCDDPAVIIYTSGSTGNPKGVMLSHASLCRSGELLAKFYKWDRNDVFLNLGTLHAMSGLRNTCITPFTAGASILIAQPEHLSSLFAIIELIKNHKVTILGCIPIFLHHLKILGSKVDKKNLKSLKMILSTGSMLDPLLATWVYQHFGIPVLNYYGLTETTGFCAGHTLESFLEDPTGIGLPVGATIDIVSEQNKILGNNEIGEIRISGPDLMLGYYKQLELTHSVIKDGMFYTGDMAIRKPNGRIILVGRKNNIIKNIFSEIVHFEEVEQTLEKHPTILEAGVCSFQSEFGYEKLAAFIVPSKPVTSVVMFFNGLREFLQKNLGTNKVPEKFYLVEKLPRNSSGKLMRKKLTGLLDDKNISR